MLLCSWTGWCRRGASSVRAGGSASIRGISSVGAVGSASIRGISSVGAGGSASIRGASSVGTGGALLELSQIPGRSCVGLPVQRRFGVVNGTPEDGIPVHLCYVVLDRVDFGLRRNVDQDGGSASLKPLPFYQQCCC
jgi:hypothetical protein